ncbi:MAG: hypothetical protein IJD35_00345, partial [Clostridia bacterium]|nr:hypothetical protein [Clostridia bacterium]
HVQNIVLGLQQFVVDCQRTFFTQMRENAPRVPLFRSRGLNALKHSGRSAKPTYRQRQAADITTYSVLNHPSFAFFLFMSAPQFGQHFVLTF